MRQILRLDEALNRLVQRHAGRDEDRQDDRETGDLLRAEAAQKERDPERHRRKGIAEVVDEVCEERDRAREHEDRELGERGQSEDREAERHRLDALARAYDRPVDEAMGVTVAVRTLVSMRVRLCQREDGVVGDGLR